MAGWIQHPITLELIPRSEYVRPREAQHSIFGDLESFVSPIDGTVITGRKGYAEHCRKHGVVNAQEFDSEWKRKAEQRESFYKGDRSKEEIRQSRQQIYETIVNHERKAHRG